MSPSVCWKTCASFTVSRLTHQPAPTPGVTVAAAAAAVVAVVVEVGVVVVSGLGGSSPSLQLGMIRSRSGRRKLGSSRWGDGLKTEKMVEGGAMGGAMVLRRWVDGGEWGTLTRWIAGGKRVI